MLWILRRFWTGWRPSEAALPSQVSFHREVCDNSDLTLAYLWLSQHICYSPSVELLMRLLAFCVPTIFIAYIG